MDFDRTFADYLDDKAVDQIQTLEKETGMRILAFSSPPATAKLSEKHLEKLKKLEEQLCVRLVAYETH